MKDYNILKKEKNSRRHTKIIKQITKSGHKKIRLSVYRSLDAIYAQLIDDSIGKTLVSASSKEISKEAVSDQNQLSTKVKQAYAVGKLLAEKAERAGIKECVFDRNYFRYHGRVKAVADGARAGGIKF